MDEMTEIEEAIDEARCPLCGQGNSCGAHRDETCWCCEIKMPKGLIELVPQASKNKACICKPCIERYQTDPVAYGQWRESAKG